MAMGVPDVPGTHAATCKARMVVSNQPGGAYPKGLLTAGAALMYIPVLLVGPRAAVCLSLALWKVELEAAGQGTERNSCRDEKLVVRSNLLATTACTALDIKHAMLYWSHLCP